MVERKIKKQLLIVTTIVAITSAALCAVVLGMWNYLYETAHQTEHSQMRIETTEYKNQILKQINKNHQILTTLSKAYEVSNITEHPQELANSIIAADAANSFRCLAYMSVDGEGILSTSDSTIDYNFKFEDCHEYIIEAIEKSFKGENAVSKIFESTIFGDKVFIYSVPVYSDGEVIGALMASDQIEIFSDIVDSETTMGGKGYVHIINNTGKFLVRSEYTIVKENIDSIFDGSYLTDETKDQTISALESGNSTYGEFTYKGENCHFFIEPIGLNDWYLFCANRVWGSNTNWSSTVTSTGIIMFIILLLMLFIMFFGYFTFRRNTKYLIKNIEYDSVTGARKTYKFEKDLDVYKSEYDDYSIIALDVHNFKFINDLFGTDGGDEVLRFIKNVIESNLHDNEFFCRDAADLFYILMKDVDEGILKTRIRMIIDYVSYRTLNAEYSYEVSLYAGIAIRGDRQKALFALQSLKAISYNNIAVYDNKLREKLGKQNDIERYMHKALQDGEFKLFLQPKYDLKNGGLIGAEALVRWQKPDGNYRFPNEFIPIFEHNGFCTKLDMYMVEQACILIRKWIDAGKKPLPISINQSKMLFFNGNYAANLEAVLKKYDVDPSLITIEILEHVAENNLDEINDQINELHRKGFKISMDDFGSGYSSLNMLYKLNIDELKLDRGFLSHSEDENNKRRDILLKQIIIITKKLGITTVAEGIENENDRNIMISMMCDYGQGYFYDKPISASEFDKKYMG